MNAAKLVGIALIACGVLGLVYGGFSYTRETHETKIGPPIAPVARALLRLTSRPRPLLFTRTMRAHHSCT